MSPSLMCVAIYCGCPRVSPKPFTTARQVPKAFEERVGHAYLTAVRDAKREECAKLIGIDIESLSAPFAVEGAGESGGGGAARGAWCAGDLSDPPVECGIGHSFAGAGGGAGEGGAAGDAGWVGGLSGPSTESGSASQPTQAMGCTGASRAAASGGHPKRSYSNGHAWGEPGVTFVERCTPRSTINEHSRNTAGTRQ